ncbi:peptidoglycan-binding domain-containing protein [Amycolatopsis saalfeldensis]|uniref:Multidrug efflux pump subunit AcrA (Membrane-fusion protein) n=1 Tax=Amycolatopsis saalfeldensis TaxID=394193 RepID=A0A1H8YA01_9PSEU|nr:peptidoglycan-binding domain-containing protein [Amycolatopsis saalfeldensis]SEP48975.1 Multidrug efflux pump subunit AcrA (membrane-fusion protein) [Amycolatopsis saalfeldensis]
MRKRVLAGVCAATVLVAGGATAYAFAARPAPPTAAAQPAPPVTTAVVKTTLTTSVTLNGSLGYGKATVYTGREPGTLTWLPAPGTVVHRGERLYTVDAKPVLLFVGDLPLYRPIDGTATPGPDLREVNANLRALGYRGAPTGDAYTEGTAAALKALQHKNKLDETGTLGIGGAAVLPGEVRVDSQKAQPGAPATAELLALTGTARQVTATVDPAQVDVALLKAGGKVDLTLPDGSRAAGTVTAMGPDSAGAGGDPAAGGSPGGGSGGSAPGQSVTVSVDDQSKVSAMDSGGVGVVVTLAHHDNVLAVPVGALLALQEGGYAVQVVTGGATKLVAVRTGLFADGRVEVSGDGLAEGQRVVTVS